ncbi:hypothetical protein [Streptomyces sp. NEAU-NA10]|uniref:hypothetical protein n=1 Tax=Streptomyces sp. NEAU-NA10 TaxID=3416050 RepID=UPI003CC590AB
MPSRQGVTTCPSCNEPIRWAITEAGRRQPVNPEPDDRGNVAVYTDATGTLRARALTKDRPTPEHLEWRAMPHVATCAGPEPRVLPSAQVIPLARRRRPAVRRGPWQRGQR